MSGGYDRERSSGDYNYHRRDRDCASEDIEVEIATVMAATMIVVAEPVSKGAEAMTMSVAVETATVIVEAAIATVEVSTLRSQP